MAAMRQPLVMALVALSVSLACGGHSPAPSPSPGSPRADFTGAWHGEYRVTTCTGGRNCFAQVGSDRPYVLALAQVGAEVSGVFMSDGAVVDVRGNVGADDQLRLQAAPPSVVTDVSAFTRFEATLTVEAAELRGVLEFTIGAPFFGSLPPTAYTRGGDIRSSVRDALTPITSYAGQWRGEYIVRACTPVGWPDCHWAQPGASYVIELALSQSGDTVTGTAVLSSKTIPVIGVVSAGSLTLTGELTTAISGGTSQTRIVSWTSRRDVVGRLFGQFHASDETVGLSPAPMSMTYDAELVGVVFVP
jgi:hypothetical protein